MEIFNLFKGETDTGPSGDEPPGYELTRAVRVGKKIGATQLGMSIYELPPGQAICPYHFEWTDEEWLIVLDGTPLVRTPEAETALQPGDTVCFPAGPAGAHHVRNAGDGTVRVGILSTKNAPGIAEYPDSDKVGVWVGDTHYMLRRSEQLDYWDGERG
jgi:uncharacterized cupin superfamily protein